MKKILSNEAFWFVIIMTGLTALMWYRMSSHYAKVLEGTKYQVLKKDTNNE